jgi:hypothetical protein
MHTRDVKDLLEGFGVAVLYVFAVPLAFAYFGGTIVFYVAFPSMLGVPYDVFYFGLFVIYCLFALVMYPLDVSPWESLGIFGLYPILGWGIYGLVYAIKGEWSETLQFLIGCELAVILAIAYKNRRRLLKWFTA